MTSMHQNAPARSSLDWTDENLSTFSALVSLRALELLLDAFHVVKGEQTQFEMTAAVTLRDAEWFTDASRRELNVPDYGLPQFVVISDRKQGLAMLRAYSTIPEDIVSWDDAQSWDDAPETDPEEDRNERSGGLEEASDRNVFVRHVSGYNPIYLLT